MASFNDFVERPSGPSATGRTPSARIHRDAGRQPAIQGTDLNDLEFEGFEVDDGEDEESEDTGMVRALETGFVPGSRASNSHLPPLFALSLVQYTPPSAIVHLTSANNILFLAAHPLSIIIIDLNKPEELVTIDLPRPAPEKGNPSPQGKDIPIISQLYADPTARHLITTTNTGDAFYLPISPGNSAVQSRRPRPLRLRQAITTVAWSPFSGQAASGENGDAGQASKVDYVTPPSTDVLLGTATGHILSLPLPPQDDIFKSVSISMSKPLERDLQDVYALPEASPVTGLAFGFWPSNSGKKGSKRAWVAITSKDRLYEVQGNVSNTMAGGKGGGWAEELFKTIRDGPPNFQELPGDPPNSQLRTYLPTTEGQSAQTLPAPSAIAWLTAPGIFSSPLSSTPTSDIFHQKTLLTYPQEHSAPLPTFGRTVPPPTSGAPPIPIAFAVTEWHFLLLYPTRTVGLSRATEKVVWDETLSLAADERALGLSADPVSRTYWIFTERSIIEVIARSEDRDVWRAKMEKQDFVAALKFARTAPQRDVVLSKQGDAFFEEGRFINAAQCYAKSNRSFEYVALRFMDVDERDALRVYLSDRLDLLDKKDRTQRMMLATWLVEIYLSKCNTLEDIIAAESATSDVETLSIEKQMMEEDMRNFVTTYQHDLEPKVIYELILSHGRMDLYLFVANLYQDYGKVIEHWVAEEDWLKAVDVLNRQSSLDLYYRFASLLMRKVPKEMVDSLLRRPELSARRLIPAMLQQPGVNRSLDNDHVVRYLNHVITYQHSTDPTIHNLLLTLYATNPDPNDEPLLAFLQSAPEDPVTDRPYYDLDYALRLCRQHNRILPCVHIYSKMGLYESSVDLALEKGDLELAKINADRPEDDEVLRRKLWLKIAKYVVQEQKDIKSAMTFLEATDLVKIEDILPFFPDFVVIDDFKNQICDALEEYSQKIEDLKVEMDEATQSAESIKQDIANLANRFVTIDTSDKCWHCGGILLTRQFYVFPCQHVFHADCLITMAMKFLPAASLRRILKLQDELVSRSADPNARALLSTGFPQTGSGQATPRHGRHQPTSGNAATDLLLGVTGRNKLLAAGDRLRDLIIPDALGQALSLGSTGKDGAKNAKRERDRDDGRAEEARKELDELVAGVCPLCESSVVGLDKPFIGEGESVGDWEV